MAILIPGDDEDGLPAAINATPLVDVMLVLLIIFLITVPVAVHTVSVHLPRERVQRAESTPQTVTVAVDAAGRLYWNDQALADIGALRAHLEQAKGQGTLPDFQLRGDRLATFESVGRVLAEFNRVGVVKIGFITDPAANQN